MVKTIIIIKNVNKYDTIYDLKKKYEHEVGIPPE